MDSSNATEQTARGDDIVQIEEVHEVLSPKLETCVGGDSIEDGDDHNIEEVEVEDETGKDNDDGNDDDDASTLQKKKKKKKSHAYDDFIEVTSKDGANSYQCKHCKSLLCKPPSGTTSHLWNHLKRCLQKKVHVKKQTTLQLQQVKSKFELSTLSNGRYDHMKQREAVAHWILMHEQPFNVVENYGFSFMFKVNLPQFEKISRTMAKNDVISVY